MSVASSLTTLSSDGSTVPDNFQSMRSPNWTIPPGEFEFEYQKLTIEILKSELLREGKKIIL